MVLGEFCYAEFPFLKEKGKWKLREKEKSGF